MNFLIDQPVSPILAEWLRSQGHDAFHLRERGLSRLPDHAVFALAQAESRVIVTADLDFSRLLALSGKNGPGLILFRAGSITDTQMLDLLKAVIERVESDTLVRSVVVVDQISIRVAELPIRPDLGQSSE